MRKPRLVRHVLALVISLAACAAIGCGPEPRPGGDDDDDAMRPDGGVLPPGGKGVVSGTVWMPGNAPGLVPAGQEIPVAGAVIYVSPEEPKAIPEGVYCDPCQMLPAGAVKSDAKGRFELTGVPAGPQRLVIEKAQFRLVQDIQVDTELGVALPAERTTLPSRHDPAAGQWIPRVAIATGDSDHVEDVLGKLGILEVDPSGTTVAASFAATDRVELWGNPVDPPFASQQRGTITELFGDLNQMKRYHIIFVPCNYESNVAPLAQATVQNNIRAYVAAGGKLYVTDWSAEWEDAAFPEYIEFDASQDTTAALASAGAINPGDGDFGHFALHARADDAELLAWLDGQQGPVVVPLGGEDQDFPSTYTDGTMVGGDFIIEGAWNMIRKLGTGDVGTDPQTGMPLLETPKTWISGDYQGQMWPHTVTFEPSCGRVLYSTYHTAQQPHAGLVAQERVLLYLIMELGTCNDGPWVP